jgi:prepilin-type N-terminal cleavage/methylation domain-containing protein
MFTQKHVSTKKGFTLIELMVVIVIIGILAAIAIPKLFGMSAKAKASEVGPAAGTWVKMQQAYKMETSSFGTGDQISYKIPGGTSGTGNFTYDAETEAEWKATSKFSAEPCVSGSEWSAKFSNPNNEETPLMKINSEDCVSLTPSFYKIGCTDDAYSGILPADKCSNDDDDT